MTSNFLDPNPVAKLMVNEVYRTNYPFISWSAPESGEVDNYTISYFATTSLHNISETTSISIINNTELQYGEKYAVEVRAIFKGLQSQTVQGSTVIGQDSFLFLFGSKCHVLCFCYYCCSDP